jgi:hypothetical protein
MCFGNVSKALAKWGKLGSYYDGGGSCRSTTIRYFGTNKGEDLESKVKAPSPPMYFDQITHVVNVDVLMCDRGLNHPQLGGSGILGFPHFDDILVHEVSLLHVIFDLGEGHLITLIIWLVVLCHI